MCKCDICNTKQVEIGSYDIKINSEICGTFPHHNINLLTFIKGKHICDNCMDIYYKIYALRTGEDFSCGGNKYYADGRNL